VDGSDGRQAASEATRPWPLLGTLTLLVAVTVLNNAAAPDLYVLLASLANVGLCLPARAVALRRRACGSPQLGAHPAVGSADRTPCADRHQPADRATASHANQPKRSRARLGERPLARHREPARPAPTREAAPAEPAIPDRPLEGYPTVPPPPVR